MTEQPPPQPFGWGGKVWNTNDILLVRVETDTGIVRLTDFMPLGGLDGYAEWFFRQQPEAIAVSRVLPWFRGEIKSDYRSVGRASEPLQALANGTVLGLPIAGLLSDAPLEQVLEEVAKVEHGMTRHILRLQVIVLRYVKALLAFLTTALAVFTSAAWALDGTRARLQLPRP